MADDIDPELDPDQLQAGLSRRSDLPLIAIRILSAAAALVAGYLAVIAFLERGLPLGCGDGSGCAEVLKSRWSSLFGVPVGGFACAAYVGMFVTSWRTTPQRDSLGWTILTALAALVSASAAWFVVLQLLVMRAICPWCMVDHALGLALAGCIFWFRPRSKVRMAPIAAGVSAATLFIVLQVVFGTSGTAVGRLPSGQNADTGPGPDRVVSILDGSLVLNVHELPVLGSPDAPKLVVLLFDYCCPHCRATHGFLRDGLDRYPDQYGVILLPMPLDADCNPHVPETEPRFENACDLAKLALAVWRTKPEAFAEFDRWLFEPELPRGLDETRTRAVELCGDEVVTTAADSDWIQQRIADDVEAYHASGAQQIPVILAPAMDGVVGRPQTAEELFAILEAELGLAPGPTP